jgi:hypothetical protein
MSEIDKAIQAILKEWPVAVVYVQGHRPEASAYAHENKRVDVHSPYRSSDEQVARWIGASVTAGMWLDRWYQKHPKILRKIAPLLPKIIEVLQTADINEIERLFRAAEAKKP